MLLPDTVPMIATHVISNVRGREVLCAWMCVWVRWCLCAWGGGVGGKDVFLESYPKWSMGKGGRL